MPAVGKTQGPEVRHGAEPMTGTERLNGASFEKLREVGLSVSQARRVLACRERQGGFASVDELDVVPGLPHELLGQLKAELAGPAHVPATHLARAEVRPTRVSKTAICGPHLVIDRIRVRPDRILKRRDRPGSNGAYGHAGQTELGRQRPRYGRNHPWSDRARRRDCPAHSLHEPPSPRRVAG